MVAREHAADPELACWLHAPDAAIAGGRVLKAGNSATVAAVAGSCLDVVIKRYNSRGLGHTLRRSLRISRARRAWQNHHRLTLLGIPTARPLAVVEERLGRLVRRAYLVTARVPGPTLAELDELDDALLDQIAAVFRRLEAARLVHGDMKATNWLLDARHEVHLVDLDALRPAAGRTFERGFTRDVQRFAANWPGAGVAQALTERLGVPVSERVS